MAKFNVSANGIFWGEFEGNTAEEAIQAAANEHGTTDVGQTQASTEGMTAEEVTTKHTPDEIRHYLASRYESDHVKTGDEASENEAGLYFGEGDAWLVFGTMPNTNKEGWFFAGYSLDVVRDMRDDA